MSATNLVLANDLVFCVGQGAADDVAAALAPAPLADAAFVLLLLELHAAVNASSPITNMMVSFRNIRYPPG
jgi:hypothetical protein